MYSQLDTRGTFENQESNKRFFLETIYNLALTSCIADNHLILLFPLSGDYRLVLFPSEVYNYRLIYFCVSHWLLSHYFLSTVSYRHLPLPLNYRGCDFQHQWRPQRFLSRSPSIMQSNWGHLRYHCNWSHVISQSPNRLLAKPFPISPLFSIVDISPASSISARHLWLISWLVRAPEKPLPFMPINYCHCILSSRLFRLPTIRDNDNVRQSLFDDRIITDVFVK